MSQDEEDVTKNKLNNNHYHYKNNNNNGRRTTTKTNNTGNSNQQVMPPPPPLPLYENFTINNNNKTTHDHSMLERVSNKSATFNYEYRSVQNATVTKSEARDKDTREDNGDEEYDEYENVKFQNEKQTLDKKILLQKYFRSALVGPRTNIYENLCRGCNYGVFNARGPLCTFCECIVNGVSSIKSDQTSKESLLTSNNNIYENICEYCGLIYSGFNENECKCQLDTFDKEISEKVLETLGSEELLICKEDKETKKVKLSKSKSFNKSTKPKLFSNFWDTLRKPKQTTTVYKKPLEIIHHVEGYEQVFHTKDTFDLQRICELKRNGTSSSDQHIYGRLKQNDCEIISQEDFNSTQSLTQSYTAQGIGSSKKPRISKPKFLRSQSTQAQYQPKINTKEKLKEIPAATIYLNDSVCHWMTSLRRQIITYNSSSDDLTDDTVCYPKSIPSKNLLGSCKAPVTNTASVNSLTHLRDIFINVEDSLNITEIVTLRRHNSMTSWNSWEFEEVENNNVQILQKDHYQLMVEEFITQIIQRRQQISLNMKAKQDNKQTDNVKAMAGVNNNDSYNINNNISKIPLRQATLTTTTNNNNNRHKRQGMYLRLEDQLKHEEEDEILQNTSVKENIQIMRDSLERDDNEYENIAYSQENKTVLAKSNSPVAENLQLVSSSTINTTKKGWDLLKTDKRQGIHESNVLEAFEALLRKEQDIPYQPTNELDNFKLNSRQIESHKINENTDKKESSFTNVNPATFGVVDANKQTLFISLHFPTQIFDVVQLIEQQQISSSLNTAIICYDTYLILFQRYISQIYREDPSKHSKYTNKQLVRKFYKFYNYCQQKYNYSTVAAKPLFEATRALTSSTASSSNLKLDLFKSNSHNGNGCLMLENQSDSCELNKTKEKTTTVLNKKDSVQSKEHNREKVKTPPLVPKRDPKTKLSPTTENKLLLTSTSPSDQNRTANDMTKPAASCHKETITTCSPKEEESIYQPIWKFQTKGEVPERYHTDDDYYDIKELKEQIKQQNSTDNQIPKILISTHQYSNEDEELDEEDDHNNWEPDEEFVFTKQIKKHRSGSLTSEQNSTIASNLSSSSSIGTASSLSGSTITEFASSTATLASNVSSSLMHHLFRNIGIFYSLTEPKLRAVIYDYDRIHSSSYFAKNLNQSHINDSGFGKSPFDSPKKWKASNSSYSSNSPSNSAKSSPTSLIKRDNLKKSSSSSLINSESVKAKVLSGTPIASSSSSLSLVSPLFAATVGASSSTTSQLISNSVQAWKYQLLDVNYMEDEEDMVVSESEILRAQQIREDIGPSPTSQPQQFLQRFKSRSTDNLDLPSEDDKKTITERIANMYTRFSPIQRGILNINGRNSPKSEKKAYKLMRKSQTSSLYLEEEYNPKYPIFAAPLIDLELHQNVPRFVVDAVTYIERKDRIIQDGLYRACGNKFSIDELKQKLQKSCIYETKLLVADDIHTITSLLKQFFRDLTSPLIPQDIYSRITSNLADKQGIDAIRIAIEEMREPNKSTLRFLIKHLTNVAVCSSSNRMNASNLAIVWGPSLFAQNDTYDMIGRMNTLTKVLIENYDRIFDTNERLL